MEGSCELGEGVMVSSNYHLPTTPLLFNETTNGLSKCPHKSSIFDVHKCTRCRCSVLRPEPAVHPPNAPQILLELSVINDKLEVGGMQAWCCMCVDGYGTTEVFPEVLAHK